MLIYMRFDMFRFVFGGNIQRIHAPKFQGRVFLRSAKRHRQAEWAHHAESNENRQNTQDTCSKIPGACFSEVGEAPQAG